MVKQALTILIIVVAFGILVPWYKGLDFLDPVVLAAYSCLAVIFVAPASAEAFGGMPKDSSRPVVLGKLATIVGYGWGVGALILVSGIVTVNLSNWHGHLLLPRSTLLLGCLLFALSGAAALAALSALIARNSTPRTAKGILRTGFLVVLLSLAFGSRFFPPAWRESIDSRMTTDGITSLTLSVSVVFSAAAAGLIWALLLRTAGPAAEREA